MKNRLFIATFLMCMLFAGGAVSQADAAKKSKKENKVKMAAVDVEKGTKETGKKVGKGGEKAGKAVARGSEDVTKGSAKGVEKTGKATATGVKKVGSEFKKIGKRRKSDHQ